MDKQKVRGGVGIGVALAVTGALAFGGYTLLNGAGQADNAQATTHTAPVATSVATPTDSGPDAIERAQIAAQKAAAEAQAQADAEAAARAAADAAAAQAAADAAAKIKSTPKTSGAYAPGQAPKGTPLPMHEVTDPNNGNYGQMEPEDPGVFCAARSGSTINGIPQCD